MIFDIDKKYYDIVSKWWQTHGWPALPKNVLPKRAYISVINEKPLIAGFLYKDDSSSLGMLEWIVANPDADYSEKTVGFNELITHIDNVCKNDKILFVLASTNNKSLKERYLKNGFIESDQNMTHFNKFFVKGE